MHFECIVYLRKQRNCKFLFVLKVELTVSYLYIYPCPPDIRLLAFDWGITR